SSSPSPTSAGGASPATRSRTAARRPAARYRTLPSDITTSRPSKTRTFPRCYKREERLRSGCRRSSSACNNRGKHGYRPLQMARTFYVETHVVLLGGFRFIDGHPLAGTADAVHLEQRWRSTRPQRD